jgi:hypothetical protein
VRWREYSPNLEPIGRAAEGNFRQDRAETNAQLAPANPKEVVAILSAAMEKMSVPDCQILMRVGVGNYQPSSSSDPKSCLIQSRTLSMMLLGGSSESGNR